MQLQDTDFELDPLPDPALVASESEPSRSGGPAARDACQVRRMIERRAELKRLRELLDEPDLSDFD
jgi:hypothetical protein